MRLWKIVLLTLAATLALAGAAGVIGLVLYLKFDIALGPRDLELASVEVIPTADALRRYEPEDREPRPGLSYRIRLTSRWNIRKIADDWSMHTYVLSRFHVARAGRAAYPWISGPFQDGSHTGTYTRKKALPARRGTGPYTYEVFVEAVGDGRYEDDFNTQVPYDLLTRPEPVSLKLGGGNMALQAFRTNEIEIPAQTFAEAFARYQRNQTP